MNLTDAKLDELLALSDKATHGERMWVRRANIDLVDQEPVFSDDTNIYEDGHADLCSEDTKIPIIYSWGEDGDDGIMVKRDDAAFIAACSPETIRALVEEVKNARSLLAYLEQLIKDRQARKENPTT